MTIRRRTSTQRPEFIYSMDDDLTAAHSTIIPEGIASTSRSSWVQEITDGFKSMKTSMDEMSSESSFDYIVY